MNLNQLHALSECLRKIRPRRRKQKLRSVVVDRCDYDRTLDGLLDASLIHRFDSGNTTIEEHPYPAVWLDLDGEHRHGGRQWIEAKWSPHSATISTAVSTSSGLAMADPSAP